MITAIAIDDEPIALEVIRSHAEKLDFLRLKAYFTNAFKAITYLEDHSMDILFLDINMPDISGMDVLKKLVVPPLVIFTTAYAEHAVQGFELDAVDYLLKPFSFTRFEKAVHKAHELLKLRTELAERENKSIMVKCGYQQVKLVLDDIIFLEANGNYVTFFHKNGQSTGRLKLAECELLLQEGDFVRIHRSFMVNRQKIERMDRDQVMVKGGHYLPVSTSYKKNLV
ncbi:LytR/AlgR family response regulator transcription factor [Olivibacter sitiensis]|uniref:LytR/AlgR family response regulator transcription factor n=1 Tax=Olivibacter sitiensis TaxID=376470 RepID=UPI00041906DC|nr:LytTR family DNA-binding domain-containing protein [Olivibacter sitiensis]